MTKKSSKKSPKKASKVNVFEDENIKDFIEFFKIEFKTKEELEKMSKQLVRQYECRSQRWHSLIESHIDFEIFKALKLFSNFDQMIAMTKDKLQEIRSDPQFETKHDSQYKKQLLDIEDMSKEVVKQLNSDRKAFDDIYYPYEKTRAEKKRKELEEKEIKIEDKSDSDSGTDIKEEYISEDEDEDMSVVDIKYEDSDEEVVKIKTEYISEEESNDCKDFKKDVKDIKTEFDSKLFIKSEIKREIKSEFKSEVKEEIKSEVKSEYYSEESEESD